MDQTIKAEWIRRLESGKYNKGKGYLKSSNDDSYCCLGVLEEIVNPDDTWQREYKPDFQVGVCSGYKTSTTTRFGLPKETLNKAGLTSSQADHLAQINDLSDSFAHVIEVIRAL